MLVRGRALKLSEYFYQHGGLLFYVVTWLVSKTTSFAKLISATDQRYARKTAQ